MGWPRATAPAWPVHTGVLGLSAAVATSYALAGPGGSGGRRGHAVPPSVDGGRLLPIGLSLVEHFLLDGLIRRLWLFRPSHSRAHSEPLVGLFGWESFQDLEGPPHSLDHLALGWIE